jgi:hypothetical protein
LFVWGLVFGDRVLLCNPGWPWTHCVTQAGLQLSVLLPQLPECWDGWRVLISPWWIPGSEIAGSVVVLCPLECSSFSRCHQQCMSNQSFLVSPALATVTRFILIILTSNSILWLSFVSLQWSVLLSNSCACLPCLFYGIYQLFCLCFIGQFVFLLLSFEDY